MTTDKPDDFDPYPEREIMADQERKTPSGTDIGMLEEQGRLRAQDPGPEISGFGIGMAALYLGLSGAAGTLAATLVTGWVVSAGAFVSAALLAFGLLVIVGVAVDGDSG